MSFCIMFTLNHASSGMFKDKGAAVLDHRRSHRAVHQHIDRDLARDPAFLRQQYAFGECQHLHGEAAD